ncbi:hypothetical protein IWW39_001161 [Coemansia spiralis]|uniref:Uncharacterized protein n=1 Tax=Coemansia spiralis TaxID=417178 RepID=A0A9W8GNK8_9FUNG|nr:hypothetical protein IWW39_001161 [Coemansia spiralis]
MASTSSSGSPPPRRTLWDIYKGIAPRHRVILGMGFMAFSMVGIWASDKLEKKYPPPVDNRVARINHSDTMDKQSPKPSSS